MTAFEVAKANDQQAVCDLLEKYGSKTTEKEITQVGTLLLPILTACHRDCCIILVFPFLGAERASPGVLPAPQEGPGFPGEDTAEREGQEEGTATDRSR